MRCVVQILRRLAQQNIFLVELKHITQMVFGDDRKPLPLQDEIELFREALAKAREEYPRLQLMIIICGLKIFPNEHP